jgi:hypothetical protein
MSNGLIIKAFFFFPRKFNSAEDDLYGYTIEHIEHIEHNKHNEQEEAE